MSFHWFAVPWYYRLLVYVVIVTITAVISRKWGPKTKSKSDKYFLPFSTLFILTMYIVLCLASSLYQNWFVRASQFDAKVTGREAVEYVRSALDPITNLTCANVVRSFRDKENITLVDDVPRYPEPYSQYTFLLRGYKVDERVTYVSPSLPDERIPKALIEKTLTNPPYTSRDEHFSLGVNKKQRNDTLFFRVNLTDLARRDSILPTLIEEALHYSYFAEHFYPSLPEPSPSTSEWMYMEISHAGKMLYHNKPFDTTKVHLIYDDWDLGVPMKDKPDLRFRVFCTRQTVSEEFTIVNKLLWRWEWGLFILYTILLILTLRGTMIRETITSWWEKRKQKELP